MNTKNTKKIIIFCLYSIIALSATNLLCAQKKRKRNSQTDLPFPQNILNSENDELLPSSAELIETYFTNIVDSKKQTKNLIQKTRQSRKRSSKQPTPQELCYNFADIDTKEKYTKAANKLSAKKSTENIVIICNICKKRIKGKNFSETYSNIHIHREKIHKIYRSAQERGYSCAENCPSYDELSFSSVNTPEKYQKKILKLGTITRVAITCNNCDSKRTGLLKVAYSNMLKHNALKHCICRYNRLHTTTEEAKKCKDCCENNEEMHD